MSKNCNFVLWPIFLTHAPSREFRQSFFCVLSYKRQTDMQTNRQRDKFCHVQCNILPRQRKLKNLDTFVVDYVARTCEAQAIYPDRSGTMSNVYRRR